MEEAETKYEKEGNVIFHYAGATGHLALSLNEAIPILVVGAPRGRWGERLDRALGGDRVSPFAVAQIQAHVDAVGPAMPALAALGEAVELHELAVLPDLDQRLLAVADPDLGAQLADVAVLHEFFLDLLDDLLVVLSVEVQVEVEAHAPLALGAVEEEVLAVVVAHVPPEDVVLLVVAVAGPLEDVVAVELEHEAEALVALVYKQER